MLDILCVGNATIDVFLTIDEKNPHVKLDDQTKELRFGHGEKIEIKKMDICIGGNAANVAVGISRLGFKSALVAEIGKDEFSQKIINHLKEEKVDLELVEQMPSETSSLSVGIYFKSDRTLFVEHVRRDHDFDYKKSRAKFMYLTSLGPVWEKAYEKALAYSETNGLKLFLNPGTLQIEKRDPVVWQAISNSEVLFVNKEEAEELLYGKEIKLPSDSKTYVKKLLYGLKSLGAKIVVITDGKNGSYLTDESGDDYFLDVVPCKIVEKTGAGDAFNAGFISAVLNQESLQNAMVWGTLNSVQVIGEIGAEKGLLSKDKMNDILKTYSDLEPKKI